MKLYRNGIEVYSNPGAYVDAIEEYLEEEFCDIMKDSVEYVTDLMESDVSLFRIAEIVDCDIRLDDKVLVTNVGTFVYPWEFHECDSSDAINWWEDILNKIEAEKKSEWEIVMDD